ncbi:MAG: hypothetical protein PHN89_00475 [Candidatus Pacebacteria bacterium]|nr:hypothetical protein [Candidatus Paceibacterota bacterium]
MTKQKEVQNKEKEWKEGLNSILDGIDKTEVEYENGWWETSVGANFGEGKKEEIEQFIDYLLSQKDKEIEELKRYIRKGKPTCSWCGKPATKQTVKGEYNLKSGGLSVNDDWYCDECYQKGLEMEKEAMYGN